MNQPSDMDAYLESLLQKKGIPIEDDGFSRKVLSKLPGVRSSDWESAILIFGCLYVFLSVIKRTPPTLLLQQVLYWLAEQVLTIPTLTLFGVFISILLIAEEKQYGLFNQTLN